MVNNLNINFSDPRLLFYFSGQEYWMAKMLQMRTDFNYKSGIKVLLFYNTSEMSGYLGIKVPNWVTGAYSGNEILMLDYEIWKDRKPGSFFQTMVHEFAHIIISNKTNNMCPMWLNEGLALFLANQNVTMCLNDECFLKDNVYDLSYNDDYLYNICAKSVEKLISTHGIEAVLGRLNPLTNFLEDDIFGIENMKSVLYEMKKARLYYKDY